VLRQLAGIYRDGTLIQQAIAKAEAKARRQRPALEQRLASISAEITRAEQALERYYEAFEQGKLSAERCDERLSRLQTRLEDLRGQHAELTGSGPDQGTQTPTCAELGRHRRPTRPARRRRRTAASESAPPPADRRAQGQRPRRDPAHLPRRHAHGLRNV